MNAFTQKPNVSEFVRKVKNESISSKTASKQAERMSVVQSAALKLYSREQRNGGKA